MNKKNTQKILFIQRPSNELSLGTGTSSTFYWLKKTLVNSGKFEVLESKMIFNIKPFRSILSVFIYDYVNPVLTAFKYRKTKISHVVFMEPAQGFFIKIIKKILKNAKIVVIVHDFFYLEYSDLYHRYIKRLYRKVVDSTNYIITTTEENKILMQKQYPHFPLSLIFVLPWGITIGNAIENKKYEKLDSKKIILGYLGSSQSRKRLDRMIDVIEYLSEKGLNIHFIIGGPIASSYIDRLKKITNSNFSYKFLGQITENEKVIFYNSIHAFIFSTELEGFGLPILEAFYYKIPCILWIDAIVPAIFKKRCLLIDGKTDETLKKIEQLFQAGSLNTEENYIFSKTFNWNIYICFFLKNT